MKSFLRNQVIKGSLQGHAREKNKRIECICKKQFNDNMQIEELERFPCTPK
jgi:hypothetical protein